jgi:hypothetical protein
MTPPRAALLLSLAASSLPSRPGGLTHRLVLAARPSLRPVGWRPAAGGRGVRLPGEEESQAHKGRQGREGRALYSPGAPEKRWVNRTPR